MRKLIATATLILALNVPALCSAEIPDSFRPITLRQIDERSATPSQRTTISRYARQVYANKHPQSSCLTVQHDDNTRDYWQAERGITVTQDDIGIMYLISRGFAARQKPTDTDPWHLFSRKCAGAVDAYIKMRDYTVFGTCVTFDYNTDDLNSFNFGQTDDVTQLQTVYEEICKQAPNARIVIVGDCKGALTALRFASTQPAQLAGLILLAPLTTLENLTSAIAQSYLLSIGQPLLQSGLSWLCPRYQNDNDHIWQELASIPDIPIIIGHRKGDALVLDTHHEKLVERLRDTNHQHVHPITMKNSYDKHSWITPSKRFQQELHQLRTRYGWHHKEAEAVPYLNCQLTTTA